MAAENKTVARLHAEHLQKQNTHIDRQKRKKQRLVRRLILFSILVALLVIGFTGFHMKQRHLQAEKRTELAQMKKEYSSLQKKGKSLKEERDLLKDEDYVLEIARTNYFFSKKGELIFKIPDEDPSY